MKSYLIFIIAFLSILSLSSCEEEFIPDTIDAEQAYIVEGYVNSGDNNIPPYVILTKSVPFFSELGPETLNGIFVNNALVSINDQEKEVILTEICLDQLTPEMKDMFTSNFGLDSLSENFNFCVYVDIAQQINIHENGVYDLTINVDDKEITASTTIPPYIGLDSMWVQETPGTPIDTLRALYCRIDDPINEGNYYQYKNSYVGETIKSPPVSSIADFLFDGKDFKFPMARAFDNFDEEEDFTTAQFFKVGDSIQVEWICIDKEQYEFWNTLELDRVQQGPFSSYVKAKTNVIGGIGVFMGKSSKLYKIAND